MTEATQIARAFFVAMGVIIFAVERLDGLPFYDRLKARPGVLARRREFVEHPLGSIGGSARSATHTGRCRDRPQSPIISCTGSTGRKRHRRRSRIG
jgi:hypothetical protein